MKELTLGLVLALEQMEELEDLLELKLLAQVPEPWELVGGWKASLAQAPAWSVRVVEGEAHWMA